MKLTIQPVYSKRLRIPSTVLHGDEEAVYGDSGYLRIERRCNALSAKKYRIMARPSQILKLPQDEQEQAKHKQASIAKIRAKAERCYATVKRLFGWRRTVYRGLKKMPPN